jgi:hypothetical protein
MVIECTVNGNILVLISITTNNAAQICGRKRCSIVKLSRLCVSDGVSWPDCWATRCTTPSSERARGCRRQFRECAPPKQLPPRTLRENATRRPTWCTAVDPPHPGLQQNGGLLANFAMVSTTSSQVHHPSDCCGDADIHSSLDRHPLMTASIGRVGDFSFSS